MKRLALTAAIAAALIIPSSAAAYSGPVTPVPGVSVLRCQTYLTMIAIRKLPWPPEGRTRGHCQRIVHRP